MFQAKQRVGEYILDEPVGHNPYAEEWRAHHHAWSDQLALVKIPTDPEYIANLQREGIRFPRLIHPNILCPLGFDPKAQPPYLVTEYVKGETLRPWINNKELTVTRSVNILRQILEGLQFGHERQVIHGDIRPENILLDGSAATGDFARSGSLKLMDFSVGQAATALVTKDEAAKAKAQGGSLTYVAPEQRDGAPADVKSDIYAVGVVLFEMLTGERPSGAEMPSELNPEVPNWLDDAFKKSYARRERRFESAKMFLAALSPRPMGSAELSSSSDDTRTALKFRSDNEPAAPAIAHPVEPEPQDGGEIGLAADDDSPATGMRLATSSGVTEEVVEEEQPSLEPEIDEEQADGEKIEEQQEAGADTAALPQDAAGGEPVQPPIARVASPADRDALFDEINKKQVRTPDELRSALKGFFELRDMDQGESANIRLRLMKWANSLAGGNAQLEDQITLINAAARPFYVLTLLPRSTRGDEPARSQSLEHPIGDQAGLALRSADYRLIAHFSATALSQRLLESISNAPLRTVLMNMMRETHRELFGRLQREDLLIYRANVLTAAYRFDGKKYRAFMVGNSLGVVSAGEPFTKIRQEPTKRAATLLNGEQIHQGMKELRRGLDDPQWESKANGILTAWRGKLAAAYVQEARQHFKQYAWLESLEYSGKAGQLVPGHEDALAHSALVRKRMGQLQLLPGTFIAVILIGLSILWSFQSQTRPIQPKPLLITFVQSSLLAAGLAAWIATLWSNSVLKMRMARTDFAFYQAAVFPLLVALSIAFVNYRSPISDAICAGLLTAVIVADVVLFKKLRKHLLRPFEDGGIAGDGLTVLNRIETMLRDDWEKIHGHYMELGPLYSFTSVQATQSAMGELFQGREGASSDETVGGTVAGEWTTEPQSLGDAETGDPEVDRLAAQMNARISAFLRTLGPSARMLMTIFNEYTKAVGNHQLGMMQANAGKLEIKGKDLAGKLADFDRLCKSPLALNKAEYSEALNSASDRLAARAEDPDIQLLRTLAERAKSFREDQTAAAADITALGPQVEAAIERLKKG